MLVAKSYDMNFLFLLETVLAFGFISDEWIICNLNKLNQNYKKIYLFVRHTFSSKYVALFSSAGVIITHNVA